MDGDKNWVFNLGFEMGAFLFVQCDVCLKCVIMNSMSFSYLIEEATTKRLSQSIEGWFGMHLKKFQCPWEGDSLDQGQSSIHS